jgi:hydroxyacid-oxoacid transhydrogenase
MSVALNAPAVSRFTSSASPERHRWAAGLVGVEVDDADDAGEALAQRLIELLRRLGMPNGLSAIGYGPDDLDDLVAGTLPQHTVTKLSPRPASAADLRGMFRESMTLW